MAKTSDYLALDLGAESGRGLLGRFDGERLELEEVHRFPNGPVRMVDTLYWDLPRLFDEIKIALRKASAAHPGLDGVGVDTWGVDFGLIGRGETLLGNPVHYRDARTEGMIEEALRRVPRERIYEITGLAVPAVQHGLSAPGAEAVGLAAAGGGRDAPDDARPVRLAPDRPTRGGADDRLDDATARPEARDVVRRPLRGPGPAPGDPAGADRAGDGAGPAARVGRRGGRLRPAVGPGAGDARHGQRRRRRAGGGLELRGAPRLVLHQLGDVVAAGGRGRPRRSSTRRRCGTTSRTRGGWRGRPGS